MKQERNNKLIDIYQQSNDGGDVPPGKGLSMAQGMKMAGHRISDGGEQFVLKFVNY